jgi:hypothetical protein
MSTNPIANAGYQDVALAARLVAAISADDTPGWSAVIAEVRHSGRMEELALALATRVVQIAGEFYDTDRQAILDGFAFDACGRVNRARGSRDTDDD